MWTRRLGPCRSLPSTRMWSRSRSALLPSSVTGVPLTTTRLSRISSSAFRREARPARERIFCRRSSAISSLVGRCRRALLRFGGGRRVVRNRHTPDLLEFLQRRQLTQILQPELLHELLGGLIQDGLADHVFAATRGDQ